MNVNNENSNIDSVDENQLTGDASILSGNQLLGSAVSQINTPSSRVIRGDEEELSNKNEKNRQLSAKSHKAKKNQ